MAHLLRSYPNTSLEFRTGSSYGYSLLRKRAIRENLLTSKEFSSKEISRRNFLVQSCSTAGSTSPAGEVGLVENNETSQRVTNVKVELGCLATEFGWKVRRLAPIGDEIREASHIQAQAFYESAFVFNDFFFELFKAEVLAGLMYKLRNSPQDRYACLVAEAETGGDTSSSDSKQGLVGVVDVTVLRDQNVLNHLPPDSEEYLYISGIAVLESFRRRKIATVLLKACDMVSSLWGFKHLVLRAYEDDFGARELYSNAGYRVISVDPPWLTTWVGRKRRVLMVKQSNLTP
ncbi:GCN5-related N-acetyltransferase 10, chloroplastic [Humulus lupulus]|uniref:GCN5-related N-acetyltransferase 10, chloroplastic n=1 Tax=Humulus lupulus TaxID=3486 RepID=UPI002B4090D8|nr:GCN5-related N-acetyltransferase 10, chloroplastic [Humulus lupulus]